MATKTYHLVIGEEQRQMIIAGLKMVAAGFRPVGSINDPNLVEEEIKDLLPMFEQLPKDEAEHPGILHGFCL